ncbi:hypothetical protein CMV30_15260 [Nibricoccus aquaticus]|uniref:CBM20 domain-containing protein n=1 Tax=Nibricoccus aquaticus TaxID=2576891 RepID=A0A290Q9U3_9BACT|nr:hypothetical protein [Nibricoccus aquaticus]ATC65203.1 hypothetical protein CMV30_15260 [Nibricoccus aquaticus]
MKKATATKTKTTPAIPAPVPAKKVSSPVKAKAPAKAKPAKAAAKAPAAAPTVKTTPPMPVLTTITAEIDIGFGNTLWIRGDGPGLSWETGLIMDCVADDKWSVTLADAGAPVVFKFLVNDLSWSAGTDYVVKPGGSITLKPTF